jgi:hypothetical protein
MTHHHFPRRTRPSAGARTPASLRRLAVPAVASAAALAGLASPAHAATAPTAVLSQGVVTVTGTDARDVIDVSVDTTRVTVDFNGDGSIEAQFRRSDVVQVTMFAGGGNDGVVFTGTGAVPVTISGGAGSDFIGALGHIGEFGDTDAATTISGNGGNDSFLAATPGRITVRGGVGDDFVDGGGAGVGHETVLLGDGNDRFVSSLNTFVGARSDTVSGGAGQDRLEANGTFASEGVHLSASAGHLVLTDDLRDLIDSDDVEDVTWVGFGGNDGGDSVVVNDLSGTDVTSFAANFTDPLDNVGPNNSDDQLTVEGTAGVDDITVSGSGKDITVAGLHPTVTAVNLSLRDVLRIDTLGGQDTVDSSALTRGLVTLQVF